jgi:smad nuclear-interacting protein 1
VIDLESTNGTKLNGEKIDPSRYLEIRTEDMIQFGESTREYVFIKDPNIS